METAFQKIVNPEKNEVFFQGEKIIAADKFSMTLTMTTSKEGDHHVI